MTTTYTVRVEPLGAEVSCREDQTVLDACLREGVWLPHACTHGTCGTCKAIVLDGDIDLGSASPFALLDSEREEGCALLCVARPRGDLVVEGEVDIEDGVEVHPVRDHRGRVVTLEEVAPDVRRVVLDLTRPMPFNAGQYVQLVLPGGDTRPYSIANSPSDPRRIELHVRRHPGGAATDRWIFKDLAVGDEVALSGPYGTFSWRPARDKPVLLVGTGTGLAPLASILAQLGDTAAAAGWEHEVVLYHGVATKDELYDRERYERLQQELPWFSYRPAVSREPVNGRQGRVTDLLAKDFPRASGRVAYLCGSPRAVEDTMKVLMRARLFPRDILREGFFDSADRASGTHVVRSPLIRR
ncbi:2Fe-2S iron-sulfur cluster binding domain-containing protein [Micromonospora sp. WMMC415]|uniref:NADH:ubiquinone reductase (Na(+)-transporting) subunit F n=1 Tax=Micromonospora sp. WMMC415 TaxID=2675222 RepID=UPI0012B5027C|nr:2Fe-2S iron-sulfur cluster-binding protein [Micromonospora sp. WMMC415]QGN49213.1 2Fe-2S iron-sulfur cluster binding domain-containing protein [Micromonospora sp. WMMC415]